jgi:ADP-ribosylglycohydrolase
MARARRRLAGCLIGQCLGDAIGFPVEGEGPPECAAWSREVLRSGRIPGHGAPGFAFGQYSDGSQMAREAILSWRDRGGFDPADYAGRIARMFAEDRIVGRGRTTEAAALRLLSGVPWDQAGTPAPAAGNGSAMRAAPIGLLCRGDAAAMVHIVCQQSRITHADPRCQAGAVAMAGAIALAAAADGRIEPAAFLGRLCDWTGAVEPSFASALRRLEGCLELPPARAARLVAVDGLPPGVDSQWHGGISAFVVGSVLWALYAFLRTPDDYLECIDIAIDPGGDVDTTAAMAGAMAGARLGLDALPQDLAHVVNDRGAWGYDDLVALAERCMAE